MAGSSGIVAEMLKSSNNSGTKMIAYLINANIKYGEVPADWESSYIINLYKVAGGALETGNYRGFKLLDHATKTTERISYNKRKNHIDKMKFGFVPRCGTNSDAIFILRQLQ